MKRYWIYATVAAVIVLSFVLSDSLRQAIVRRRAIHRGQAELKEIETQVSAAREKLTRLENDPSAYEQLVREELGYLRPREKEIRFLNK